MRFLPVYLLTLIACASSAGPGDANLRSQQSALAGGTASTDPQVVMISGRDGTLCTGTVIAERVVLSAKHCVQAPSYEAPEDPSTFTVGVGDALDGLSSSHLVIELFVVPGAYSARGSAGIGEGIEGNDVALLVVADALPVTPAAVLTTPPTGLTGTDARIVGFGTTPSGMLGDKLSVSSPVLELRDGTIVTGPATCSGDSGGPLFDSESRVVGVSSFNEGGCGLGTSHFNRLDVHADLIAAALAAADACTPTGPEVCDARDNDCNGMVDEGCTALGAPCVEVDECAGGGICSDTPLGQVCSVSCDPRRPTLGCGVGLYCARGDFCDGFCVSGSAGEATADSDCVSDTDCASLACVDPGDGRFRCAVPCEADDGTCSGGLFCAAVPFSCGGCVADGWSGARGLGELCDENSQCLSNFCDEDGAATYCSRFCDADDVCGAGYHCRDGGCARGPRGSLGEECRFDDDCHNALSCTAVGDAFVCTEPCSGPEGCTEGFTCELADGSNVCVPERGLLGEECATGEDCVSGLCAETDEGLTCTRECNAVATCPASYLCVAPDDGSTSVCIRIPDAPMSSGDEGGCSATSMTPKKRHGLLALGVATLLFLGRRRRLPAR